MPPPYTFQFVNPQIPGSVGLTSPPDSQAVNPRFVCVYSNYQNPTNTTNLDGTTLTITYPTVTIVNAITSDTDIVLLNVYDRVGTTKISRNQTANVSPVDLLNGSTTFQIISGTNAFTFSYASPFLVPTDTSMKSLGTWYRFQTQIQQGFVLAGNSGTVAVSEPIPETSQVFYVQNSCVDVQDKPLTIEMDNVAVPGGGTGPESYFPTSNPSQLIVTYGGVQFTIPPNPDRTQLTWEMTSPNQAKSLYYFFVTSNPGTTTNTPFIITAQPVTPGSRCSISSNLSPYYQVTFTYKDPSDPTAKPQSDSVPGGKTDTLTIRDKTVLQLSMSLYEVSDGDAGVWVDIPNASASLTFSATTDTSTSLTLPGNNVPIFFTLSKSVVTVDALTPVGAITCPSNLPSINSSIVAIQNSLAVNIVVALADNSTMSTFQTVLPNSFVTPSLLPSPENQQYIVVKTADNAYMAKIALGSSTPVSNDIMTLSRNTASCAAGIEYYQVSGSQPWGLQPAEGGMPVGSIGVVLVNLGTSDVTVTQNDPLQTIVLKRQPSPVLSDLGDYSTVIVANSVTNVIGNSDTTFTVGSETSGPLSSLLAGYLWNTSTFWGSVQSSVEQFPLVTIAIRDTHAYISFAVGSSTNMSKTPPVGTQYCLSSDTKVFSNQVAYNLSAMQLLPAPIPFSPSQPVVQVQYSSIQSTGNYPLQALLSKVGFVTPDGRMTTTSITRTSTGTQPDQATITIACLWNITFSIDMSACSKCQDGPFQAYVRSGTETNVVSTSSPQTKMLFTDVNADIEIGTNMPSQQTWRGKLLDILTTTSTQPVFPENLSGNVTSYIAVTQNVPSPVTVSIACVCGKPSSNVFPPPFVQPPTPSDSPMPASTPSVAPTPTPSTPTTPTKSKNHTVMWIIIAIVAAIVVAAIITTIVVVLKKDKK